MTKNLFIGTVLGAAICLLLSNTSVVPVADAVTAPTVAAAWTPGDVSGLVSTRKVVESKATQEIPAAPVVEAEAAAAPAAVEAPAAVAAPAVSTAPATVIRYRMVQSCDPYGRCTIEYVPVEVPAEMSTGIVESSELLTADDMAILAASSSIGDGDERFPRLRALLGKARELLARGVRAPGRLIQGVRSRGIFGRRRGCGC